MIGQASVLYPRVDRLARDFAAGWNRIGEQTAFYFKSMGLIPEAVVKYRVETLRKSPK